MMERIVEFFFYFGSYFPLVVICYLPFTDRLARPARKIAAESALACAAASLYNMILFHNGIDSTGNFAVLALFLPGAFYYRRTVREGVQKILFTLFIVCHIGSISAGMELIFYLFAGYEESAVHDMLKLLIRLTTYFIIGWILHRFYTPRLRHINSRDMKGLWIVPIPFILITMYYYTYYFSGILTDTLFPVVLILFTILFFTVLSFTIYGLLLRMLDGVTERARLETQAQRIAMEKELAEQRLAEENAALARINRLRAEMIATISHEARTPLAVLASYASLVSLEMQEKHTDPQMISDLDKIAYEAKRVAGLIDRMKNLPIRKEKAVKWLAFDLGGLVKQTAELYQHILDRAGVVLVTDIADDSPPMFGNPEELTQVVFNLLQNAKNHTMSGSVTVALKVEGNGFLVSVADTGKGIPPELLPYVFEHGTHGGEGTGIGLAVCREIISAHGGDITIESEPGKGTVVIITLPVYHGGKV